VAGAAIATIIAQFVSGIMCLVKLMRMRDVYDVGVKYLKPVKRYIMQITRLGLPTGVSQAVFSLAMVTVQALTNSFGENFIATNGIVMRIDGFVIMPTFTFGTAMMVFAGQNVGAGKLDRVKQGAKQCAFMSVGTAIVIVILILVFGRSLAGMFTTTEEIISMSVKMLGILSFGYLSFAFGQTYWSVVRGAGDTVTPMWVSIFTVVILRVPLAYLFNYIWHTEETIFYSMLISWCTNAALGYVAYRMGRWRKKGLVTETKKEALDTL
jgi:putative MATE family efflux protein